MFYNLCPLLDLVISQTGIQWSSRRDVTIADGGGGYRCYSGGSIYKYISYNTHKIHITN